MSYIETKNFHAGEGNRLFVYFYGLIFSSKFNIIYIHPGIPSLNIKSTLHLKKNNRLPFKKIINYKEELAVCNIDENLNYILDYGYNPTIENYKIFIPYFDFLKKKFPPIIKKNNNLVFHFRAGDNILTRNYRYIGNSEKIKTLIDNIEYDKLYVVTNLKIHKHWTISDLNNYKEKLLKYGDCGARYTNSGLLDKVDLKESLKNLNSLIDVLNNKNAIWISDTIFNDFNTIRESNKIIIGISTFSWWAAILSNASEVYASKNWKFLKGNRNKNLPFVELDNWKAVDF
jgi:hypothetical protein